MRNMQNTKFVPADNKIAIKKVTYHSSISVASITVANTEILCC